MQMQAQEKPQPPRPSQSAAAHAPASPGDRWQPNELDLRRIQRSLKRRARYRYVSPVVHAEPSGYRVESACCSRNVDASGGRIDIAWLEYDALQAGWRLHSKNHATGRWELQARGRLHELLALLAFDPQRLFWQ